MLRFLFIFLLFFISCKENPFVPDTILEFDKLPSNVRLRFKEIYEFCDSNDGDYEYSAPFVECYNISKDCECKIYKKGGVLQNPYFLLESCENTVKIPWTILQRVFIIKGDSLYYPIAKYSSTTYGKPRSYNILIDTLSFGVKGFVRVE